ncbi:olfactory receptor 1019-like, partial [Pelobates cultripes]
CVPIIVCFLGFTTHALLQKYRYQLTDFASNTRLHIFFTVQAILSAYLIIILSNLIIFASIILDSHLHTPMYIFLCNLSVIDISYTSTTLPNLLAMLLTQCKTISFLECFIQLYFFMCFASTEILLLAAMAYDRYVAICHPLHYSILMSPKHCVRLVLAMWVMGLLDPVAHTILIANLSYCHSHHIDHFFCDVTPLLKLTCSDTFPVELCTYIYGTLLCVSAFTLTLVSYVFIISTILNIQSSSGRRKAFSTCSSHITCVIIFYGTIISMYMRPTSVYSPGQDKFFALLYIVLIPILNPLIYTLKNKDFNHILKTQHHDVHKIMTDLSYCCTSAPTVPGKCLASEVSVRLLQARLPQRLGVACLLPLLQRAAQFQPWVTAWELVGLWCHVLVCCRGLRGTRPSPFPVCGGGCVCPGRRDSLLALSWVDACVAGLPLRIGVGGSPDEFTRPPPLSHSILQKAEQRRSMATRG